MLFYRTYGKKVWAIVNGKLTPPEPQKNYQSRRGVKSYVVPECGILVDYSESVNEGKPIILVELGYLEKDLALLIEMLLKINKEVEIRECKNLRVLRDLDRVVAFTNLAVNKDTSHAI